MNKCRDCKFWTSVMYSWNDEEGWRECQAVKLELFMVHGMHTEGFLQTAPDFGCVAWEQATDVQIS